MYQRWAHLRDLKGACPVCGEPAHVGMSERTGRLFWLHDKFEMSDYYERHAAQQLVEISRDEFEELLREAREKGLDTQATRGGAEAVSKRVRCVETGVEYRSVQAAADAVSRSRASLSAATKRGGTCAGFHWEFAR